MNKCFKYLEKAKIVDSQNPKITEVFKVIYSNPMVSCCLNSIYNCPDK